MTKKGIPFLSMVLVGLLPNVFKRIYYRMRGAKLGRGVKFGLGSYVSFRELEMGDDAKIGPFTFVRVRSLKMGKRCEIRAFTAVDTPHVEMATEAIIMEQVVVGGLVSPRSRLVLGKRVKVFPYSILNPTEPLIVEDDASVGGNNAIFTHGSWKSILDGFPVVFGPVHVKKRAWLPWRLLIMPNVTIGEDAVIGGGSVVLQDVAARTLVAGTPAKIVRTDEEFIRRYTPDEKHEIVLRILKDFTEYLQFMEHPVEVSERPSGRAMSIKCADRVVVLLYERTLNAASVEQAHIVVSLEPMAALHPQLTQQGKIWFDLGAKQSSFSRDPMWLEVRTFFGRYGIRFDVQD